MDLKNTDRKNTDRKNTDRKNTDLKNTDLKDNDPYNLGRDRRQGVTSKAALEPRGAFDLAR